MPPQSRPRPVARFHRLSGSAASRGRIGGVMLATLVGVLLALLLFAPARWLAQPLALATGDRLVLVNARGSIWQGQGNLLFTGGEGSNDRTSLPGTLNWTLRPHWTTPPGASGRAGGPGLMITLHMDCCMATPLSLHWFPGWVQQVLHIPAHQSTWPATLLTGLGTPWNTLQLQANLMLVTPGLDVVVNRNTARGAGSATLDIIDASSRLSTIQPMGSYRLSWHWPPPSPGDALAATSPTLTLQTLNGALQLTGQGQWIAGRLRFEGSAEAASGREEALNNLMNLLGRRQGNRTLIKIG